MFRESSASMRWAHPVATPYLQTSIRAGAMHLKNYLALRAGLAAPVTRGGKPVCWVSMRPLTGVAVASFTGAVVEFFLRALV